MKKSIGIYILGIKLFFLCISIAFLIRGFSSGHPQENQGNAKVFVVDREDADIQGQINAIEEYLAATTGQAIALATKAAGETTLLLPATRDYEIYRTYLHTISSGDNVNNATIYEGDKDVMNENDMESSNSSGSSVDFVMMIVFMLLALFL